jgi:hypothetical protein
MLVGACQHREHELEESAVDAPVETRQTVPRGPNGLGDAPSPPTSLTCGGANITTPWGELPRAVGPNNDEIVVEIAPHPVHAMTGRTFDKVFSFQDPSGTMPQPEATLMAAGDRAILDRTTGRFGIRLGDTFDIYSATGNVLGWA